VATQPTDLVQKGTTYTILTYPANQLPANYTSMIFSKWLRSLRNGNEYFKIIDTTAYHANYHRYIEVLMARPNSLISIAVLSDAPDTALGWSMTELDTLHYVYVFPDNRKIGIAQTLIPHNINTISHLTKQGIS
jgi:hypothetical protein